MAVGHCVGDVNQGGAVEKGRRLGNAWKYGQNEKNSFIRWEAYLKFTFSKGKEDIYTFARCCRDRMFMHHLFSWHLFLVSGKSTVVQASENYLQLNTGLLWQWKPELKSQEQEKQFSSLTELPGVGECIVISVINVIVVKELTWAEWSKLSGCSSTEWEILGVGMIGGVFRTTELCEQKQRGRKQH